MENVTYLQLAIAICVGVSLSAACGFRVFVPLLLISVAVHFFGVSVSDNFQWVGSWTALLILLTATVCEILAYYIPWVDNILDVVGTPLACAAGMVVMSGMLPEMESGLRWSLSAILGGGVAGVTQAATVAVRGASTATTGGVGNNVVATTENVCSTTFSILALVIPILAFIVVVAMLVVGFMFIRKFLLRKGGYVLSDTGKPMKLVDKAS